MKISGKQLTWITILIAVIILVVHNISIYPWMIDDAFISFRYAVNFSQGNGIVFNAGEKVEGYTSFLWVVLMALGSKTGFDIVLFSKFLGFFFGIASLLLLAHSYRFINQIDRKVSTLATLFLGTCGVFTPWASSGMEVNMFAFLTLLTFLFYLKIRGTTENSIKFILLGTLCAVTSLARPEGLMVFSLIFIDLSYVGLKNKNRGAIYLLVSFLALYLPYFTWRYSYYGFLFPNTFYNKVGFSIFQVFRGVEYTAKFALTALGVVVPIIELLFGGRIFKKIGGLYLLLVFAASYAAYTTFIGGDVFPAFRFYAAILPILSILAAIALVNLVSSTGTLVRLAIIIALFNIAQLKTNYHIYFVINVLDKVAEQGKEVGLWLKENLDPDAVVAVNSAGAVSYYSELKIIDMLGLTDSHIAHRKMPDFGKGASGHERGDGDYVLSRKPDYIQFGTTYGWAEPEYAGDEEIFANPEFRENYALKTVNLISGNNLLIYERLRQPR